jgi:hypothetical protein
MLADKSAAFANMAPVAFIRSGWNTKRAGNVLDVLEEVQRQDNVVRPQKVEAQGNNQNGLDQRVRWKLLRHGGLSAPDTKLTRRGADRSRLARSPLITRSWLPYAHACPSPTHHGPAGRQSSPRPPGPPHWRSRRPCHRVHFILSMAETIGICRDTPRSISSGTGMRTSRGMWRTPDGQPVLRPVTAGNALLSPKDGARNGGGQRLPSWLAQCWP